MIATLEYRREYQRQRRAVAREAKLCIVCCVRPATEGTRCDECKPLRANEARPSQAGRPHRSAPDRFCVSCQAHGFHRFGCEVSS